MLKIIKSHDRLIFNMGIPYLGGDLYIETGSWIPTTAVVSANVRKPHASVTHLPNLCITVHATVMVICPLVPNRPPSYQGTCHQCQHVPKWHGGFLEKIQTRQINKQDKSTTPPPPLIMKNIFVYHSHQQLISREKMNWLVVYQACHLKKNAGTGSFTLTGCDQMVRWAGDINVTWRLT